ncbi:NACHT domain-containing protein [Streptomyces sp. NPDC047002]|uniref:NACHT domain-containing protein n=1 Tax=Streptomyces sp. NPDC047002 TaxID=3155475 RepID=UPI003454419E
MGAGPGGRRQRRAWAGLVVAGVLGTAATSGWVWARIGAGQGPADTASLVSLAVSVAGLVVGVAGLGLARAALGSPADAASLALSAAATLARQVERAETAQWRALVGKDWTRINLRYTVRGPRQAGAAAERGQLFHEAAAPSGLRDIAAHYRAAAPARLVVTGAPGAGKTVLALELLLALVENRAERDPVPVRVSLAGWQPETSLDDLLIAHLVDAYDWPQRRAAYLVEQGLVLPVLDGLDEMDASRSDPAGRPGRDGAEGQAARLWRTRRALRALDEYGRGLRAGPVILTCRSEHYDALAPADRLSHAAEVAIDPVTPSEALRYLGDRYGGDARWGPLLGHLRAHPAGTLATSLSTPWRLCLTATVHHRSGDPTELLRLPTARALDRHLLRGLVPASHQLHPYLDRCTPDQTHRRLALIARHLGPHVDIRLTELWPIGGRRLVLLAEYLLFTLFLSGVAALLYAAVGRPDAGLALAFVYAGMMPPAMMLFNRFNARPARTDWRALVAPAARGRLRTVLLNTAALTLFAAMVDTDAAVYLVGPGGCSVALFAWTTSAFHARAQPITSDRAPDASPRGPGRFARADLGAAGVAGITWGAALGLATGGLDVFAAVKSGAPPHAGPTFLVAVVGWCAPIFLVECDATRRYAAFALCARARGLLPLRPGRFLACAYDAGLLRKSGNAYQFRHRELQQWLATEPAPAGPPGAAR